MAKIKTVKGWSKASSVDVSQYNQGAVIDPSGNYVCLGDEVMDAQTLHPVQNKDLSVFSFAQGFQNPPAGEALLTTRPVAFTPHVSGRVFAGTTTYNATHMNNSVNTTYKHVLDKSERMKAGTIYKFQDSAGVDHLIIRRVREINFYQRYAYLCLVEGDSLVDATNSVVFREGDAHPDNTTYLTAQTLDVLTVDTTNQVIYFYARFTRPATTYYYFNKQDLYRASYTTNAVDGSLSVSNPVRMGGMNPAFTGGATYIEDQPRFYAGLNNAGKPCFLSFCENQVNLNSSAINTAYNDADPYTSDYAGFWRKTVSGISNKLTFDVYDAGADSAVRIADLSLDTSLHDIGRRVNGNQAPSHFEPSPIAGEDDIYYAFMIAFGLNGEVGLLRFKWDKANDTFEQAYLDDLELNTWWNDNFSSVTNYFWSYSVSSTILTNDGAGKMFISLVTQHLDESIISQADSKSQNMAVFELDTSDMATLSHFQTVSSPCLRMVSANENNTKLLSIEPGAMKVWSWTAAGWSATFTSAGNYYGVGEDESGNLWGMSTNSANIMSTGVTPFAFDSAMNEVSYTLEFLSPDLPNSVSVEFVDSTIAYAGVDLTKNLRVNAYDPAGDRIAKQCVLKISSSNAVFTSNNAAELTVTTSDAADTIVSLTIDGPGFINVSASFVL